MPPYDDWNKIDDEEDEELQDGSIYETKKDVILFCIDCSETMLRLYDDPKYEDVKTCHVFTALEAAMQIEKRKIIVGPNDSVGILLFNTTRKFENTSRTQGSDIKANTYLFQPISPLSAPKVQELIQLLDAARDDPEEMRKTFPPFTTGHVPMGDVFTSCNWVLRDGAPKTASKRVFLITDEDNPHLSGSKQLITSARTTLIDLTQSGVTVEPFFISTNEKAFDVSKFYSSVLLPTNLGDEEEIQEDSSVLPESISISRIDELLSQMRFHETPKRALFSIPFHLADGFTIGVKGYGLITEQRKGVYKYFVDLGDRMEVATVRTTYVDEDRQAEVDRAKIVYGPDLGAGAAGDNEEEEDESSGTFGARIVEAGNRVRAKRKKGQNVDDLFIAKPFYSAEELRSFRTLGLEPGIKLLGFKDRSELAFEDNVKHSQFIYPDEMSYSGSKRTFSALLKSMVKKNKIGLALCLNRRNATPVFCALLPQEEAKDNNDWTDPAGFHLIPLPFADDIRGAPISEAFRASEELKTTGRAWVDKISVKNGTYPPDSFPNPALAYHNEQLEASAFREEYDPESFEDLTEPKSDMMHKRAGHLMREWKKAVMDDPSASLVVPGAGSKRKADVSVDEAEIKSKYESGLLAKLRVDQLKDFLKSKGQAVSGKKAELVDRVSDWFDSH